MFDELLNPPPSVVRNAPKVIAPIAEVIPPVQADSTSSPSSTMVDQDAPSSSRSRTTTEIQSSVIPQDVALDETLVPSAQRLRIGRSNFRLPSNIQSKEPTLQVIYDVLRNSPFFKEFLVTADVPEIYMQELWATAKLHQHSIRFKMDTRKHVLDLEAFREMLHLSPKIPGQSFAEFPFEEEILEFLRDDVLFSTIKVVSRHQTTQQYGAILPIELTTDDIRNSKAYKEYYACATGEEAPKPKASARKKKDEGTGSKPGVPDVPSDDSEEELSWNSSDDEDVDTPSKGRDESEGEKTDESDDDDDDDNQEEADKVNDDDDNEEDVPNTDEQKTTESDEGDDEATESDRESEDEETREHEDESFDPIPQTPEESEDDDNNEEDPGLRIGEEERMHEEDEADELYRDVDINQGRGLQVFQETEYSHVILTPTQSDAQQESSSTSSFMTNLLNPLIDPGMESIFTTGSTTINPIPSPQSTMTPSIISTFTTASQLPTHPT
nr:hypothetical protein [Tanacetum cinerariifolium]